VHPNSILLFKKYGRDLIRPGAKVLELGPDGEPSSYRREVSADVEAWDTLDIVRRGVALTHVATTDYSFPIADDTYDVVLSGQVIEHVRKIWRWMPELARVCRPGGYVITINPISWHFHGFPTDCWRIYPEGMRALCDDAGLDVLLSTWENVQLESVPRLVPLMARRHHVFPRLSGAIGLLRALVPIGFDPSFDTVTIAQKPAAV
jgi:SAM-dependent methyltransferase